MTERFPKHDDQRSPSWVENASNVDRPFRISLCGLILCVTALGLACVPGIALDRPLPNPFTESSQPDQVPAPPPEREGGFQLKFKTFSVSVGGKAAEKKSAAEVQPEHEPHADLKPTQDPVRWFTIAAIACALGGIVVALVGQTREKHRGLTVGSIACCVAAITWPYFSVGIAIGAAIAVLVLVLTLLSTALG